MASSIANILTSETGLAEFMIEAHDGLSAKIAERAGFRCLWGSGLTISTSLGVRDCSEATWSDLLEAAIRIKKSTKLPLLFDGDSGYGSLDTLSTVVTTACDNDIGGICIEDKTFPKQNSFLNGKQSLVTIAEHCKRIETAVNARRGTNFIVVARTESLVVGSDVREALVRSAAYAEAGADAVFIHSKSRSASEVLQFARAWNSRVPLIIAPTTYSHINDADIAGLGIKIVIASNQLLRAAMGAMEKIALKILRNRSVALDTPTVDDIFELFKYEGYTSEVLSTKRDGRR
jgi:phosphoenolpyruvate phosphomutase